MPTHSNSSNDAIHQNLLCADQTTLIIVDHQVAFSSCFSANELSAVEMNLATLVEAASKLDIPVIASFIETNRVGSRPSEALERVSSKMVCFNRNVVNPWDAPAFSAGVASANRPKLIIAGLSAESSLTFTALSALEQGYDVYVVRDVSLGFSKETLEASFQRLAQAGAVIVSWRQVMLEWHQENVDVRLLMRVLKSKRSVGRKDYS